MNAVSKSLMGMAITAGAIYFFDPVSGRRRRVLLRDQCARAARTVDLGTRDVRHGFTHRMHGFASGTKNRLSRPPSDKTLAKQTRAALQHSVSRPDAIGCTVSEGNVFLRGDVYSHEHQRALDEIRALRGVRVITDHLSPREVAEGVRRLPNASGKIGDGWSVAGRVFAGATGCALLLWGLRERKALGEFGSSVGHKLWDAAKEELDERRGGITRTVGEGIDAAGEIARDVERKWQSETSIDASQPRVAM